MITYLPGCVVTASVVFSSIFRPTNDLLRVEKLLVGPSANFITYCRLQIHKNGSRDMLSRSGLAKEIVESIVTTSYRLVTGHFSIWLDSMLEAVELPAGTTGLNTSLTNVD